MLEFPGTTKVGKILPKDIFYKNLKLSQPLKESFIKDIKRIIFENSLTDESLRLNKKSEIKEIMVVSIELKNKEFNLKIPEVIARQNPKKILFVFRFEDKEKYALFQNKLYITNWIENEILKLKGFSLHEIWNNLVAQVALEEEDVPDEETLKRSLRSIEEIKKIEKEIAAIEKKARSERQPKKKFELAMEVKELEKKFQEVKSGGYNG